MAGAGIVTTTITTPTARVLSVFANGIDLTGDVKWDRFTVTDSGTSAKGTANMTIERTPSQIAEITDQALVRVYDHSAGGGEVFRGFLRSRSPSEEPTHSWLDLVADDISSVMDDCIVDVEWRPPETMQSRIGYLWGKYAGNFLSGDLTYVLAIGGTLPAQRFDLVSLRQAVEMTIAQASSTADYYCDMLGKLHVFTSETNNAPKNINADAPGGGEIAPESLELEYDSNSYANQVLVRYASGSLLVKDDAAIAAANGLVRTAILQSPDSTTSAMANSLGVMYLGRVKTAKPRGSFRTSSAKADGWRGGQNVIVTSNAHSLSGVSYKIARVTTRVIRPGAALQRSYDVEFGAARVGAGISGQQPIIAGSTAGVYLLDQLGNAIISNAAAANSGGLGPAIRRYIMSGVYNGDFYAPPPGPDARVDDTTNPLPYWAFVQQIGSSVTAMSVADAANASGRKVLFDMVAGGAGDSSYIEQIVPINGSRAQAYSYSIGATFRTTGAVNLMEAFIQAQYLKNDGVTTTGAAELFPATTTSVGANTTFDRAVSPPGGTDAVPADAYFLKVQIGFRRGAEANGASGQVELHEVHLTWGTLEVRIAEGTDPATYGPAGLAQNTGTLVIGTGVGGGAPSLSLEGGVVAAPLNTKGSISTGDSHFKHYPSGALARRTTNQSINSAAVTAVIFNSSEDTDPFGYHDLATNPSRFTVPTGMGGMYLLFAQIEMANHAGNRNVVGWQVNGGGGNDIYWPPGVVGNPEHMQVSGVTVLNAGDYVEFTVYQNSGGAVNMTGAYGYLIYVSEWV